MKYLILVGMVILAGCDGSSVINAPGPAIPGTGGGTQSTDIVTGPAGPQGPAGAPGMTIASNFVCSGIHGGLLFRYQFVLYTTADAYASCSISGPSGTVYYAILYKSNQAGATNGGCVLTADLDTASGGWWDFVLTAGPNAGAVYHDTGSQYDGNTFAFSQNECTTY